MLNTPLLPAGFWSSKHGIRSPSRRCDTRGLKQSVTTYGRHLLRAGAPPSPRGRSLYLSCTPQIYVYITHTFASLSNSRLVLLKSARDERLLADDSKRCGVCSTMLRWHWRVSHSSVDRFARKGLRNAVLRTIRQT